MNKETWAESFAFEMLSRNVDGIDSTDWATSFLKIQVFKRCFLLNNVGNSHIRVDKFFSKLINIQMLMTACFYFVSFIKRSLLQYFFLKIYLRFFCITAFATMHFMLHNGRKSKYQRKLFC